MRPRSVVYQIKTGMHENKPGSVLGIQQCASVPRHGLDSTYHLFMSWLRLYSAEEGS